MEDESVLMHPINTVDMIDSALAMLEKEMLNLVCDKNVDFRYAAITHLETSRRLVKSHYRLCKVCSKGDS